MKNQFNNTLIYFIEKFAVFLLPAHRIVFSSPSHFVCSIELKECCDDFARKD